MIRLLYVQASPRGARSASSQVADEALATWRRRHPDGSVYVLNVWNTALPEFGPAALQAKYAGLAGVPLTEEQSVAWEELRAIAARFLAADTLLLAVPLWNFGIPYRLKHLIDLISQKDILFAFDGQRFDGLMRGRQALAVYARGLDYGTTSETPAERYDFQRPYIERWLRFIGITRIETVIVEKTIFGPQIDQPARATARAQAARAIERLMSE
jgi:FMN-dependent NADH-azoreductase